MALLEWSYEPSGLGIRKDEYSWQGSHGNDSLFFLRRKICNLNTFTDASLGSMDRDTSADLISEFIRKSGDLEYGTITIEKIAYRTDNHAKTVKNFDKLSSVFNKSLLNLGFIIDNFYLSDSGNEWSAIFIVKP